MKIAILASEAAPYIKTGGLGDVMEALPSALARMEGNEVILMLPYYNKIKYSSKWNVEYVDHEEIIYLKKQRGLENVWKKQEL